MTDKILIFFCITLKVHQKQQLIYIIECYVKFMSSFVCYRKPHKRLCPISEHNDKTIDEMHWTAVKSEWITE